jgi:alkyl sulfatase BDS1-like metallo-beta-lactamase superfamily hydrolase
VADRHDPAADVSVTTTRAHLLSVTAREATLDDVLGDGRFIADGSTDALHALFDHLDVFVSGFPIVEP